MIGLPTETDIDLAETIKLIKNLKKVKGLEKTPFNINASFTTFIPKPHTPFQWAQQFPLQYSREVISWIQKEFRGRGVKIKWQHPETSRIEGLFSRGDRKLTELLITAFNNGCRFDGWSDHFDYNKWIESAQKTGIDLDFYTTRKRYTDELLPWDHMDCRIEKRFFIEEWSRAVDEKLTPDCKNGKCQQCGICDFQKIQPVYNQLDLPGEIKHECVEEIENKTTKKIMVVYAKMGRAKYFGHLEMVNIFLRALRRANIRLIYSKGFHPMPKISFEDPLPVGMESCEERFFMNVDKNVDPEEVLQQLNSKLPKVLNIVECKEVDKNFKNRKIESVTYSIELVESVFEKNCLENFFNSIEFNVIKTKKNGKTKTLDLKNIIEEIRILDKNKLLLKTVYESGKNVRPSEIVKNIFGLSEENLLQARIIKRFVKRKDKDV
jgi:radical SAM-linked protein